MRSDFSNTKYAVIETKHQLVQKKNHVYYIYFLLSTKWQRELIDIGTHTLS
jgi:hypothetical protein